MSDLHGPGRIEWLALYALASADEGSNLIQFMTEISPSFGVLSDSLAFDAAAELVGLPYCRALDLYVDAKTKARAESLPFTRAFEALRP